MSPSYYRDDDSAEVLLQDVLLQTASASHIATEMVLHQEIVLSTDLQEVEVVVVRPDMVVAVDTTDREVFHLAGVLHDEEEVQIMVTEARATVAVHRAVDLQNHQEMEEVVGAPATPAIVSTVDETEATVVIAGGSCRGPRIEGMICITRK
jgi:hypothetical protein